MTRNLFITLFTVPLFAVDVRFDAQADPRLKPHEEHIRTLITRWHDPIRATLFAAGHRVPYREIQVTTQAGPRYGNVTGQTIRLHPILFTPAESKRLDEVVIHELTHVVQEYGELLELQNCRGVRSLYCQIRIGWHSLQNRHMWIAEGTADYVAHHRLLGSLRPSLDDKRKQDARARRDGYKQGYLPAAAFLLWLERTHDQDIVRKLNTAMHQRRYSPALFKQWCGNPLPQLWADFVAQS